MNSNTKLEINSNIKFEMNENVDIFIMTHKDFEPVVSNPIYKVIDSRKIINNNFRVFGCLTDIELSEWYHFYYIINNFILKDYVGICQYRRYFNFLDNVPDINEIFKEYDIICRQPQQSKMTNIQQYSYYHNENDIKILGNILKDKYPEYYEMYVKFMNLNIIIPCNMFIMKSNDFIKLIKLSKEIVKEYCWRYGIDFIKIVSENKDKYIKSFYPNNTIEYQSKILTYILERLTNIFIFKNFKKIKTFDAIVTENKYNLENNIT